VTICVFLFVLVVDQLSNYGLLKNDYSMELLVRWKEVSASNVGINTARVLKVLELAGGS
jgi:hypothetical protein